MRRENGDHATWVKNCIPRHPEMHQWNLLQEQERTGQVYNPVMHCESLCYNEDKEGKAEDEEEVFVCPNSLSFALTDSRDSTRKLCCKTLVSRTLYIHGHL